jgi:nicotinate phosphoribosyltransferase
VIRVIDLRLDPGESSLLVDLYELTMAAACFDEGFNAEACFDLSVRRLPARRGYLVAAGIDRVLEALEEFHFDERALAFLDSLKLFKPEFLSFLSRLRFTGEVRALAEGTLFFAEEPVIEVCAPFIEAQLIETLALNQINTASLIATKAARCLSVAGGRRLIDFGVRRSHGADAGLIEARSSYVAGFHGTSNVLGGSRYGIPLYGTMAHSYVMAHEHERLAFEQFARSFPRLSTLLVDTYDTVRGVENAVAVARELAAAGITLSGVRLDSGDLLALSRRARRILDEHGLNNVSIFASGDLDEYKIAELVAAGAPIDAFGVGTALAVSRDVPSLDAIYKLVEYGGVPRLKTSENKLSLPGRKQVFRAFDRSGAMLGDRIGLVEESPVVVRKEFRSQPHEVRAMLETRMKNGRRTMPESSLSEARERFLAGFAVLDPRHKGIEQPEPYETLHTAALKALIISGRLRAERCQD